MFPGSIQTQMDPWLESSKYLQETYSQCFSNYSITDFKKVSILKSFYETSITLIQKPGKFTEAKEETHRKKCLLLKVSIAVMKPKPKKAWRGKGLFHLLFHVTVHGDKSCQGEQTPPNFSWMEGSSCWSRKGDPKIHNVGYKTCTAWSRFVCYQWEMIEFSAEYNLLQSLLKQ